MRYKIDVIRVRENQITLNGWAIGKSPESNVSYDVQNAQGKSVPFKYTATRRDDVSMVYYKSMLDKDFGFDISFEYLRGNTYYLLISCEGKTVILKYNEELIKRRTSIAHKRVEKLKDFANLETLSVVWENFKAHGLKAVYVKTINKINPTMDMVPDCT